jgi:hypothetical protein
MHAHISKDSRCQQKLCLKWTIYMLSALSLSSSNVSNQFDKQGNFWHFKEGWRCQLDLSKKLYVLNCKRSGGQWPIHHNGSNLLDNSWMFPWVVLNWTPHCRTSKCYKMIQNVPDHALCMISSM